MPYKFRIRLYPTDTSRVKEIAFSRKWGWFMAISLIPLSMLGYWLVFSSALKEEKDQHLLRQKLAGENRELKQQVKSLHKDLLQMQSEINALEEQKLNALLLTGLEYMQTENKKTNRSLFSFFKSSHNEDVDVSALLTKAKGVSHALDSSLELLQGHAEWVKHIPTSPLIESPAIIIRGFGYSPDPFTGRKSFHAGIDFADKLGTAFFSPGDGLVTAVARDNIWGLYIQIDHGKQVETLYAHLQDAAVNVGQLVLRGQKLGTVGNSGITTGSHLHYELSLAGEKTDPLIYILPKLNSGNERPSVENEGSI